MFLLDLPMIYECNLIFADLASVERRAERIQQGMGRVCRVRFRGISSTGAHLPLPYGRHRIQNSSKCQNCFAPQRYGGALEVP